MAKCKHGAAGACPDCASDDRRVLTSDELEFGINECPPAPRTTKGDFLGGASGKLTPEPDTASAAFQRELRARLIGPARNVRIITVYQVLPQEKLPDPGESKVYELVPRVRGRLMHLTILSDLEGLYLSSFTVGAVSPIDWSCCDKLPVDSWFPRMATPMNFSIPVLPGTPVRIGLYRRVAAGLAKRPLDGYLTLATVEST